jgi:hypothetical protein
MTILPPVREVGVHTAALEPTERQPRPAAAQSGAMARDEHRPLEHALNALYELTHRLQRAVSEVEFHDAALDAIVGATG